VTEEPEQLPSAAVVRTAAAAAMLPRMG
jgi:hypothetical protein